MKPSLQLKFKTLAAKTAQKRKDVRFVRSMGFFIRKGFLGYNRDLPKQNGRCDLRDAIWAGENVEPRILEVLPAALARLPRSFRVPAELNDQEKSLFKAVIALQKGERELPVVFGIDAEKYQVWMELNLEDGRTRARAIKKRLKSFRLKPAAIHALSEMAEKAGKTETEILEALLLGNKNELSR